MAETNFDDATMGADMCSMGFDVDLGLETVARKENENVTRDINIGPISSTSFSNETNFPNHISQNVKYEEIPHMLLLRPDDVLHKENEISQVNNLTNSFSKIPECHGKKRKSQKPNKILMREDFVADIVDPMKNNLSKSTEQSDQDISQNANFQKSCLNPVKTCDNSHPKNIENSHPKDFDENQLKSKLNLNADPIRSGLIRPWSTSKGASILIKGSKKKKIVDINERSSFSKKFKENSNFIRDLCLNCYICNKNYGNNITDYKKHMITQHSVKDNELYRCSLCSMNVSSLSLYIRHKNRHSKFPCNYCNHKYETAENLRRHVNIVHFKKKPFHCNICSKSFGRLDHLRNHQKIHNEVKFLCNICDVVCSSKFNLDYHIKGHSNENPYKCHLCLKSFRRKDFLQNHIDNHNGNKKYQCRICSKYFSRKDVLKRHEKIHESHSFGCPKCPKTFSRKDFLTTHLHTHINRINAKSKRFICVECPSSFQRKEVLSKHLEVHRCKKQCEICFKFFANQNALNKHASLHEKQVRDGGDNGKRLSLFHCKICSTEFSAKSSLHRHTQRMHRKKIDLALNLETLPFSISKDIFRDDFKNFSCHLCEKAFTGNCNLQTHLRTHQIDLEEKMDDNTSSKKRRVVSPLGWSEAPGEYASLEVLNKSHLESSFKFHSSSVLPLSNAGVENLASDSFNPSNFKSDVQSSSTGLSNSSPSSPINPSTEIFTAAAYLLAHPSYASQY